MRAFLFDRRTLLKATSRMATLSPFGLSQSKSWCPASGHFDKLSANGLLARVPPRAPFGLSQSKPWCPAGRHFDKLSANGGGTRVQPHAPFGLSLSKPWCLASRQFDKLSANGGEARVQPSAPFGLSLSKPWCLASRHFDKLSANGDEARVPPNTPFGLSLSKPWCPASRRCDKLSANGSGALRPIARGARCGLRWLAALMASGTAAAAALPDLPLFVGRPAPGLSVDVADMEGHAALDAAAVTVPKPERPRVPASRVQARRVAKDGSEALQLQWQDAWYAAIRLESATPLDLRPYLADGTLEFEVRSADLSRAGLNIAMSCGPDCGRKVNHVVASRALAGKGWQRLSFAMACFQRDGADFSRVSRPFVLETSGSGSVDIANVRIKASGQANAPCPDYRSQSVTPAPLEEIWSLDWWLPRHEAKLKAIAELRAAGRNADLVFVGDSITQGWENAGQPVWDRSFKALGALALGFGGDRTENVLWRLQHGELDGIRPRVVVLMIGTNNTGDRQEDPATTAAGIRRLVDEIQVRQPAAQVLLLAVFPRDKQPEGRLRQLNQRVNQIIAGYADGRRVHFLDIGPALMNPDGTLSEDILPDLLHLSEQGYERWARAIEPTLRKLMAPR